MHTSNSRTLKLKFSEKVSSPVYTGVEIKGDGGSPLKVVLVDDATGETVDSGTNASLEVEIVVLKVDFGAGGNDSWTAEEFNDSIVRERETGNSLRRKASSLLTERVIVKLDKGVGDVHNVKFRHTSNHMKNTQYRLGAYVTNPSHGTRIQEAMTEPFLVKDQHILRKKFSFCLTFLHLSKILIFWFFPPISNIVTDLREQVEDSSSIILFIEKACQIASSKSKLHVQVI